MRTHARINKQQTEPDNTHKHYIHNRTQRTVQRSPHLTAISTHARRLSLSLPLLISDPFSLSLPLSLFSSSSLSLPLSSPLFSSSSFSVLSLSLSLSPLLPNNLGHCIIIARYLFGPADRCVCTYNSIAHKDSSLPLSVCCLCVCVCRCALCLHLSVSNDRPLSGRSCLLSAIETKLSIPLFLSLSFYTSVRIPVTTNTIDRSLYSPSLSVLCLSVSAFASFISPSSPFSLLFPSPCATLLTLFVVLPQRINRSYLSL
ncbi:hypothetical protein K457DRAFT_816349 [Linnemannia elongata AG-77]|uniref:Uncharacterized protein n=1 Tax=Linnemannia elongata AG-77 TaxID=1314771 RepID=A0A197K924_9FUNG|nr:hypothetical protein K457DRAFT_816349 [Linnemannia elongata AG-77]